MASACGAPVYVTSEPRAAEIWVDGKFVGVGSATFPTNGIVFNSYRVEARDKQGNVIDAQEVDVEFGARSAVFAGVGLLGILVWPLLPLIPAAFFVGEPDPERVHLRVPLDEPAPTPRPDELDRPVIEFTEPTQGEQISEGSSVAVRGRARHWSGVDRIEVALDGRVVESIKPPRIDIERSFEAQLTVEKAGPHVIAVRVKGVRGADAVEEIRITRIVAAKK